jgi:hypothetical protein
MRLRIICESGTPSSLRLAVADFVEAGFNGLADFVSFLETFLEAVRGITVPWGNAAH